MGVVINKGEDTMDYQRKNDHGEVRRIRKNLHRTQHERHSRKHTPRK